MTSSKKIASVKTMLTYLHTRLFNKHIFSKYSQYNLNQCILCKGKCSAQLALCHYCLQDLPQFHQHIAENLLLTPAIAKHIDHQYFDQLISFAPYQWPISKWLQALKYQQQFENAPLLAALLSTRLTPLDDVKEYHLICPPLHIKKWQVRGYNQSHLITKQLAKLLTLPYLPNLLLRTKETPAQVGQSGRERRRQIKNNFAVAPAYVKQIKDKHFLLIDDVLTTGATVNEISRILKKFGAKTITVCTLAIALEKSKTILATTTSEE